MKRTITISILAIVFLAANGNLLAQPGSFGKRDHPGGRGGEMRLQVLAVALDLTDEQISSAQEIFSAFHDSNRGSMEQRAELQQRLKASLESGTDDACFVGQQMLQMRQLGESARANREDLKTELTALLTPEQKEKFEALSDARHAAGGPHGFRQRGQHGYGRRTPGSRDSPRHR